MKHVVVVLLIALLSLSYSCNNGTGANSNESVTKSEYLIKGKIANAGGKPVYLDRLSFVSNTPVDTAIIAQDGQFTMKGKIAEKGLYLIRISNDKNWLIVLEEGKLKFEGDLNDIYHSTVSGSPEAETMSKFIVKAGENQLALNQFNQTFNQARMAGDEQKLLSIQQSYQQKYNETQQFMKSFIDTVPYPLVALFAASLLNVEENAEFLKAALAKAGQKIPNSSYYLDLNSKINASSFLSIGSAAPEFVLKSPKGESLPLSSMKGKVVLLDFWASWCRPCRAENPNLVRVYNQYKSKGFDVYSISLDKDMQRWVQAIEADKLTWKAHGSNLQGWQCSVAQIYKVSSIPATFLLDKEGKIIGKDLRGAALESKLKEVFGS